MLAESLVLSLAAYAVAYAVVALVATVRTPISEFYYSGVYYCWNGISILPLPASTVVRLHARCYVRACVGVRKLI